MVDPGKVKGEEDQRSDKENKERCYRMTGKRGKRDHEERDNCEGWGDGGWLVWSGG